MKYAILLSVMLVTSCTYVEAAREGIDEGIERISEERYRLMVRGRTLQCETVSYQNEQRFMKEQEISAETYAQWCGRGGER